jgi:hypothetical protein
MDGKGLVIEGCGKGGNRDGGLNHSVHNYFDSTYSFRMSILWTSGFVKVPDGLQ